ncbi:MAG: helix-turn-helix transcriptional regulator [Gemmatimonadota bacterium]|jgi:DNA-binding PadR family transcriptional regulator
MPREVDELLPLKPDVFLILTVLSGEERLHGYGIIRAAGDVSGGTVSLLPGALYRRLRWMVEEALIEEVDGPASEEEEDERRRYYRVTRYGRRVAAAEAGRMERWVSAARAARLVP